jgi:hypothetical protein
MRRMMLGMSVGMGFLPVGVEFTKFISAFFKDCRKVRIMTEDKVRDIVE